MPDDTIRILAICGSLRGESNTRRALEIALAAAARPGIATAWIDLGALDLPFCQSPGADSRAGTVALRAAVAGAHGLLIGSPEYHGSLTGALKNALDLLGDDEFAGKVCGLIGTAGGAMGAANTLAQLRTILRHVHAWVVPGQVSIARARHAFDASGAPHDADLAARLTGLGREVARYAWLHHASGPRGLMEEWEGGG